MTLFSWFYKLKLLSLISDFVTRALAALGHSVIYLIKDLSPFIKARISFI